MESSCKTVIAQKYINVFKVVTFIRQLLRKGRGLTPGLGSAFDSVILGKSGDVSGSSDPWRPT